MQHYILLLCVDSELDQVTRDKMYNLYSESADKHNAMVNNYLNNPSINTFDGGFDLFVVNTETVSGLNDTTQNSNLIKLNHHVKCKMMFVKNAVTTEIYNCCYYLYPRSSTGTKTPLRMANSLGVIDSGYRGNIVSVFDNISNNEYTLTEGQRVSQICPSNISYPMYVKIVSYETELGTTDRGEGGFGSTGL